MAQPLGDRIGQWLRELPLTRALSDAWNAFSPVLTRDLHDASNQLQDAAASDSNPVGVAIAWLSSALTNTPHTQSFKENVDARSVLTNDPVKFLKDSIIAISNSGELRNLEQTLGQIPLAMLLTPLEETVANAGEDPKVFVAQIQGTLMSIAVALHGVSLAAEVLGIGQLKDVTHLVDTLSEILGGGILTEELMRPLIEIGVSERARRYYNNKFHPARMSLAELVVAKRLQEIDDTELIDRASIQGWSPEDVGLAVRMNKVRLDASTIVQLYHFRTFDAPTAIARMGEIGISPEHAAHLLELEDKGLLEEQYQAMIRIARKAFTDGVLDEAGLRRIFEVARRASEQADLTIAVGNAERKAKIRDLNVAEIEGAFKSNVLAESEARHYLDVEHVTPDAQNILIATWKDQKVPKPIHLNAGTISQAYIEKVIDRGDAVAKLRSVGWTGQDANLIIEVAEKRHEATPRVLTEGAILSAFAHGIIDGGTARRKLIGLGFADNDADLLIRMTIIRPSHKTKELDLAQIVRGVKFKLIDRQSAVERIRSLGYDDADAELLLDIELEEKAPAPRRTKLLAQSEIFKALTDKSISPEEAIARLIELGYTHDDAVLLLTTHKLIPGT